MNALKRQKTGSSIASGAFDTVDGDESEEEDEEESDASNTESEYSVSDSSETGSCVSPNTPSQTVVRPAAAHWDDSMRGPTIAFRSDEISRQVSNQVSCGDAEEASVEDNSMVSYLRSLVNNEHMSDVTFRVERVSIFAHKCLCARLDFFKTIFAKEMPEDCNHYVEISGFKQKPFLCLLEYAYTNRLNVPEGDATELYAVADRCGVEGLKRLCATKLLESLSVDNAASLLHFAVKQSDRFLQDQCIAYTLRNANKVSKTKAFSELALTNPDIVVKIVLRSTASAPIADEG